jgi:hypothetical protein
VVLDIGYQVCGECHYLEFLYFVCISVQWCTVQLTTKNRPCPSYVNCLRLYTARNDSASISSVGCFVISNGKKYRVECVDTLCIKCV